MSPSTLPKRNGPDRADALSTNGRQAPRATGGMPNGEASLTPLSRDRASRSLQEPRAEGKSSSNASAGASLRKDFAPGLSPGDARSALATPSEPAKRASQTPSSDRPRSRRPAADDRLQPSPSVTSRQTSPISSSGGPDLDLEPQIGDEHALARRSLRRQRSPSTDAAQTPDGRRGTGETLNSVATKRTQSDGRLTGSKKAREAKRIKISSPSKQRREPSVELGILPSETKTKSLPTDADSRTRPRDDDQNSNDEHCYACQGTGKLLCCDDCPKSFHFTCIEPPIEEADIPDEPFYCMSCWDAKFGFPRPSTGLFQQLLLNEVVRDPVVYLPPLDIRNFFEGVSTGEGGVYRETKDQKNPKKDRHGFAEELDTFRLRDKNNRPLLCYRCGESALNGRGMVSCEHCTAHWHLDCVVPPLPNPPSSLRKWACPLHSHDIAPTVRKLKNSVIRDTALPRGHANRGDVLIALDESQYEMADDKDGRTSFKQELQPWPIHDIPPVQYRLPERGIVLDFLETVHNRSAANRPIIDALPGFGLAQAPADSRAAREANLRELVRLACDELTVDRLWDSKEERSRLLAVKVLCEAKGEDALMAFLTS